jgi:uncharacterized membrane protein (UPF0182 family)
MLQKPKEKPEHSKVRTPKPQQEQTKYWRFVLPFWRSVVWILKKIAFAFLLFVGLFIRRATYLFQVMGFQFTVAYWVSVALAVILPLSLLVIAVSFVVQWYKKKQRELNDEQKKNIKTNQ